MKAYCCPHCGSHHLAASDCCPDCGEPVSPSEWKEIEIATPPKPNKPLKIELTGNMGKPFAFFRVPHKTEIGRPILANKTSDSRFCARVQFVLSWKSDSCWIEPPEKRPPNNTYVGNSMLTGPRELKQGDSICLKGSSGKSVMHLTVLYYS